MGRTRLKQQEVEAALQSMQTEWRGAQYDLFTKNCGTFCNSFCLKLDVGGLPEWVTWLGEALGKIPVARRLAGALGATDAAEWTPTTSPARPIRGGCGGPASGGWRLDELDGEWEAVQNGMRQPPYLGVSPLAGGGASAGSTPPRRLRRSTACSGATSELMHADASSSSGGERLDTQLPPPPPPPPREGLNGLHSSSSREQFQTGMPVQLSQESSCPRPAVQHYAAAYRDYSGSQTPREYAVIRSFNPELSLRGSHSARDLHGRCTLQTAVVHNSQVPTNHYARPSWPSREIAQQKLPMAPCYDTGNLSRHSYSCQSGNLVEVPRPPVGFAFLGAAGGA